MTWIVQEQCGVGQFGCFCVGLCPSVSCACVHNRVCVAQAGKEEGDLGRDLWVASFFRQRQWLEAGGQ
jgi:hypothetical protein